MNTRPYRTDDLSAVADLFRASVRVLAAPYYSIEQVAAWAPETTDLERWRERLAALATIVAVSDGVLAGFAAYRPDGYLDLLYTHPAFARQGVASVLYQEIEAKWRSSDVNRVTTHASLAARPFFERWGFVVDRDETIECRGSHLRRFEMHKVLRERIGVKH